MSVEVILELLLLLVIRSSVIWTCDPLSKRNDVGPESVAIVVKVANEND